jgi:hypothetical protein
VVEINSEVWRCIEWHRAKDKTLAGKGDRLKSAARMPFIIILV